VAKKVEERNLLQNEVREGNQTIYDVGSEDGRWVELVGQDLAKRWDVTLLEPAGSGFKKLL
jgi:hypothetical protein